MKRTFNVLIERDEDGYLVASVPALRGCHTQARSMDDLLERMTEAIGLCLEDDDEDYSTQSQFVGIQQLAVEV